MNVFKIILQIALILLSAIFLTNSFSYGQKTPIQLIEGADDLRFDGKNNSYVVRGNVRMVKDNVRMFCDSAFYKVETRVVRAYSNVHVNQQDTANMYCDSLILFVNDDFAKLWGNVRVRDNEYKLVTDSMDFYLDENKGVYRNGGKITNTISNEVLTSKVGYLYTDSDDFFFRGDVVYTGNDYKITTDTLKYNGRKKKASFFGPTFISNVDGVMYCESGWYNTESEEGVLSVNAYIDRGQDYIEGDSLFFSNLQGIAIGVGNVTIKDTVNKLAFSGDYAKSIDSLKYAFITGHALAKRFEDENDTLFIHADTLYNFLDSLNESKLILAYNKVKLFRSDMQGVCDSLSYDREIGELNMYVEPVLWAKNAQLSGDSISVYEKNNSISKAFVRLNALAVTEVDSGNYYNQMTGKSMTAFFDSTEIRRVNIDGNAKTIYFLEDEKDEDTVVAVTRSGMNSILASDLTLYFESGEVVAASYRESPDGIIYPMDQIKEDEKKVNAFKWSNERRPISWQTMIMTDEEFEIWKLYQNEKNKLLEIKSLAKLSELNPNKVARARFWMDNYIQQNFQAINDYLVLDTNGMDSLVFSELDSIKINHKKYFDSVVKSIDSSFYTVLGLLEDVQSCILESYPNKKVFNNLLAIDTVNYNKHKKHLKKDSSYLAFVPNVTAIFDTIKVFKKSLLSVFPNFIETQNNIEIYEHISDSLRARREFFEFYLEMEDSLANKNEMHKDSSFILLDLAKQNLENNDSLFALDWVNWYENEDELNKDTVLVWLDTLNSNVKDLVKPVLGADQITAIKISELLKYSNLTCDSLNGKRNNNFINCYINKSEDASVLVRLEALKVDVLNAYREFLLYIYRDFTMEN